ncbi:MAG: helix-hairpin-helix domain-containing protein [Bacilli bacterium]|nr:helix-hairpin-helix domain-containing protein [Bacilli bacterium]
MRINKKYLIVGGLACLIILTLVSYIFFDFEKEVYIAKEEITTSSNSKFFIDVKGAVKKPGVYEFTTNERVIDALKKAGGLAKTGDTSNINLSQKLESEMVVYVYTKNEIKNGSKSISCSTKCSCETLEVNNCIQDEVNKDGKVNINTANLETLQTLSGIGESKASSIIDYRSENGNFKEIEEIKNVSGIGDALFEKIKEFITI